MITYARKEITRATRFSWLARFHTFINMTINDLEVKVSSLLRITLPRESEINGGSSQIMIIRMFHTPMTRFCFSVSSLLDPQKFATQCSNMIGLAWLKEASLSGKSESILID